MRIALPNVNEINTNNLLNTVKLLVKILQEEADLSGLHGTRLFEEVRCLREDVNQGFNKVAEKFDKVNEKFDKVNEKFDEQNQKIDNLRSDFQHLDNTVSNKMDEQTEILKMIADNLQKKT